MKCMPFWKGCNRNIDYIDQRQRCLVKVPDDLDRYSKTLEELLLDSNLIRELPNSLFRLEQLRKLTLSDNQLPRIQADFANLSNLQELDVSKNDLCQVSESIKHLKNLQVLDLSCNPLQDLPISLTTLKNLTILSINDIAICKLPQDIGNLSSLEVLEARDNLLNSLPASLGDLSVLRVLDVGSNSIDALPETINQLSSLQEIRLDYNELSELPDDIGELRGVLELDLSENKIEVLPIKIGGLFNLTDLDLSQNLLEFLPESIGELKNLIILKLDQNRLIQLAQSIGNCSAIQELILTENLLTELPGSLGKLKNMSILNADKNRLSSLPSKIGGCSRLGVLSLRENTLWRLPNDIGLLKELHVLDVSGNRLQNLPISLNSCNLKALWLSENQAQPLLKFQQEVDDETGVQVLTCFLLPQQAYTESMENLLKDSMAADDDGKCTWNEAPKSMVKFAEDVNDDDDDDEQSPRKDSSANNFVRHNTPHPKDLRLRHNKMLERNVDGHMIPHKGGKSREVDVGDDANKDLPPSYLHSNLETGYIDNGSNAQYQQMDEDMSNQLQQQQLLLQQQLIEQQLSNNGHDDDDRQEVVVRVIKTPGIGLGISIAGGLGSVPYEGDDEGIFVSKVNPTGAAEKCGVIPGDKILSVNGESMMNIEHTSAVEVLKAGGNDMLLLLTRKINNINNNLNNNINNNNANNNNNNINNDISNINNNNNVDNTMVTNNYITNVNYPGDGDDNDVGIGIEDVSPSYNPTQNHNGYLNNDPNDKLTTATHNLDQLLNQSLSPIHTPSYTTIHPSPFTSINPSPFTSIHPSPFSNIHPSAFNAQKPISFSSTPLQPFSASLTSPFNPSSIIPSNYCSSPFNQSIPPSYPLTHPLTHPQFPIEEIGIDKVNGALGLSIVGGVGHTSQPFGTGQGGIFISKITKNGPAAQTNLRVGDRLLMVDDTDVTKATHLEVVSLLVVPLHHVTIRVSKDPQPSGFKEILLTKTEGEQLGLTIVGGVGEDTDESKEEGIFISRILPNSVASRYEHLRSGQRILEVNGHTFLGVSQREALDVFSNNNNCNNTYNIIICDGLNKHQQQQHPHEQCQQQLQYQQQQQQCQPQQQHLKSQLHQSQQHLQQLLMQQQQCQLQQLPSQQGVKHHPCHQRVTSSNTLGSISLVRKTPITLPPLNAPSYPPHNAPCSGFNASSSLSSSLTLSSSSPSHSAMMISSSSPSHSAMMISSSSTSYSLSSIITPSSQFSPSSIIASSPYMNSSSSSSSSTSSSSSSSSSQSAASKCIYVTVPPASNMTSKSSSSSKKLSSNLQAPSSSSEPPSSSSSSSSVRFSRSSSANPSSHSSHLPPLPPILQNLLHPSTLPTNQNNSSSMDNLLETSSPSQSGSQKLDRKTSLDASMRPTHYLKSQKVSSEEERKQRAEQRRIARLQFLEGASSRVNDHLTKSRDVSPRPPL